MKNRPFNTGSAAVTTPLTEAGRPSAARSGGREMMSAALVSGVGGTCAKAVTGLSKRKQPMRKQEKSLSQPECIGGILRLLLEIDASSKSRLFRRSLPRASGFGQRASPDAARWSFQRLEVLHRRTLEPCCGRGWPLSGGAQMRTLRFFPALRDWPRWGP